MLTHIAVIIAHIRHWSWNQINNDCAHLSADESETSRSDWVPHREVNFVEQTASILQVACRWLWRVLLMELGERGNQWASMRP
ncbi:hypothetical protein Pan97_24090 [Bremerella volcania]|uniref:Uncharacterized protein n=1 Tax=Bremerella volcania TaxID=2527984 RepID=A0A518C838_9BACT|nr:hypothetical protein Pan97_24090 [Bremerella volcania]